MERCLKCLGLGDKDGNGVFGKWEKGRCLKCLGLGYKEGKGVLGQGGKDGV